MHNIYFNISDWIAYTQHLSLIEEATLFRIVMKCFHDETPLPLDEKEIKLFLRKLRISTPQEIEIAHHLIDEFFEKTKHGYINLKFEGELRALKRKKSSASERGKLGGRPPKQEGEHDKDQEKEEKAKKKAKSFFVNENNELQKLKKQPITHNPKPITQHPTLNKIEKAKSQSFNFIKFIEAYPKIVSNEKKQRAHHTWQIGKHEMRAGDIMKNIADRIAFSAWRDLIGTEGAQYIPDPATYIFNRMYDEDFERILTEDEKQDEFINSLNLKD